MKRANSISKFKWTKWKNKQKQLASIATSSIRASSIVTSESEELDDEDKSKKEESKTVKEDATSKSQSRAAPTPRKVTQVTEEKSVNEFQFENAWTRSFKRVKKAIGASEDNSVKREPDRDDSEEGLPENRDRFLCRMQRDIQDLRRKRPRVTPKFSYRNAAYADILKKRSSKLYARPPKRTTVRHTGQTPVSGKSATMDEQKNALSGASFAHNDPRPFQQLPVLENAAELARLESPKAWTEDGTQTKMFIRPQDRAPKVRDEDVIAAIKKQEEMNRPKEYEVGVQAEVQEKDGATQFPEAITRAEADRLWFDDETVQKQRRVYSLDEIWRFLKTQINYTSLVENKIREIDLAEDECEEEEDTFTSAHASSIEEGDDSQGVNRASAKKGKAGQRPSQGHGSLDSVDLLAVAEAAKSKESPEVSSSRPSSATEVIKREVASQQSSIHEIKNTGPDRARASSALDDVQVANLSKTGKPVAAQLQSQQHLPQSRFTRASDESKPGSPGRGRGRGRGLHKARTNEVGDVADPGYYFNRTQITTPSDGHRRSNASVATDRANLPALHYVGAKTLLGDSVSLTRKRRDDMALVNYYRALEPFTGRIGPTQGSNRNSTVQSQGDYSGAPQVPKGGPRQSAVLAKNQQHLAGKIKPGQLGKDGSLQQQKRTSSVTLKPQASTSIPHVDPKSVLGSKQQSLDPAARDNSPASHVSRSSAGSRASKGPQQ